MDGEGERADDPGEQAPGDRMRIRRRGRRVTTEASPGYIGEPLAERREESNENDERLKRDKPPHWG